MIKIGRQIRERREVLGMTQSDLASLSEVNARTIQLIEQGKGNPALDTLLRLSHALGLKLDLIIKGTTKSNDQ